MSELRKRSRFLVMLSLLLAMVLAGPTMAVAQSGSQSNSQPEPMTILLMVADGRPGEFVVDDAGDVIAVVHLDAATGSCRALNILPNTRVHIPDIGNTRVSQALPQGDVELATSTIEDLLDIEIDHHAVITNAGIAEVIDALGGITIVNETAFTVGDHHFPAGELQLSGEEALFYGRYQANPGDNTERIRRQRTLVEGLLTSVDDGNGNVGMLRSILQTLPSFEGRISTDLAMNDVLDIAEAFSQCVPGQDTVTTILLSEEGNQYDDAVEVEHWSGVADPADVQEHVDWLLNGTQLP